MRRFGEIKMLKEATISVLNYRTPQKRDGVYHRKTKEDYRKVTWEDLFEADRELAKNIKKLANHYGYKGGGGSE